MSVDQMAEPIATKCGYALHKLDGIKSGSKTRHCQLQSNRQLQGAPTTLHLSQGGLHHCSPFTVHPRTKSSPQSRQPSGMQPFRPCCDPGIEQPRLVGEIRMNPKIDEANCVAWEKPRQRLTVFVWSGFCPGLSLSASDAESG